MHFYKHHIGDFLKDTGHLSNDQMGIYLRMLWKYYLDEQPLQDDCESIAFAMRSDEKTIQLIFRHFFVLRDGLWMHKRCDRELTEYHNKKEKATNSANARWNNTGAMRTHTDSNANEPVFDANHEPLTINHKPKEERAKALTRPDDVDQQVWMDWVQLRKAKKAPVTETVLKTARKEASLANMPLMEFLEVWCARGSQGLEAAWLKPSEKPSQFAKPAPNITVPSRQERDPELTRLDIERSRSVPMPAAIREQMQKLKFGVPA